MAAMDTAQVTEALPSRLAPIMEASSDEEEADFVKQSKARHRRRLCDRWRCKTQGHSYCYVDSSSLHTGLTADDLEHWVDQLHDGNATLQSPPRQIVPVAARHLDASESITSRNSHSYQRRFRLQANPSLSDLRSWRYTLSSASSSSESSGTPGPGYLAGKATKWFGECLLDLITPLELRRRLWAIQRLMKSMEKQPYGKRREWLLKNKKSVCRLLGDLLELSSYDYKEKHRNLSKAQGIRFRSLLILSDRGTPESDSFYWFLSSIVSPLEFLNEDDNAVASLGISLREVLIQEHLDPSEMGQIIAELIVNACNEITYGTSSSSRCLAFRLLFRLYSSSLGKSEYLSFERRSRLMMLLADKVFKEPIEDACEQATTLEFFVAYANDYPVYRHYPLGSNGFSTSVSNLYMFCSTGDQEHRLPSDWLAASWTCRTLHRASGQDLAIAMLLDLEICDTLQNLLIHHHTSGDPDEWINWEIVCIFHNLATKGQESGQQKVRNIMTPQIRQILQQLLETKWGIDWMTEGVQPRISEIWARIVQ